jgi:hypothetical protein
MTNTLPACFEVEFDYKWSNVQEKAKENLRFDPKISKMLDSGTHTSRHLLPECFTGRNKLKVINSIDYTFNLSSSKFILEHAPKRALRLRKVEDVVFGFDVWDWAVVNLTTLINASSEIQVEVDLMYRVAPSALLRDKVWEWYQLLQRHSELPFTRGECYYIVHNYTGTDVDTIPERSIDHVAQVIHGWHAISLLLLDAAEFNIHTINSIHDLDDAIDTLTHVSTSKFAHQLCTIYHPKSIVNLNAIAWRQITNAIINPFETTDTIHYLLIEGTSNDHLFERAAEMFGYAMRPLRINDGMLFYTHYGNPRLLLSFFGPVIPNLDTKLGYVSYRMPGIVLLHACVAKKMQVQIRAHEGIVKTTNNSPLFEDMRMYLNKNLPICIKLEISAAVAKKVEMRKQHEDYLTGRFSEGLRKDLGLEF